MFPTEVLNLEHPECHVRDTIYRQKRAFLDISFNKMEKITLHQ